jgi:hypothetical protein
MLLADRTAPDLGARDELRKWTTARKYWSQGIEYFMLARVATDSTVRKRYVIIAQHYGTLAAAEERAADQMGDKRQLSEMIASRPSCLAR